MKEVGILALVLAAALSPTFYLATTINDDEFLKSGLGAVQAGVVATMYTAYLRNRKESG